jgi:hypothetical protein
LQAQTQKQGTSQAQTQKTFRDHLYEWKLQTVQRHWLEEKLVEVHVHWLAEIPAGLQAAQLAELGELALAERYGQ